MVREPTCCTYASEKSRVISARCIITTASAAPADASHAYVGARRRMRAVAAADAVDRRQRAERHRGERQHQPGVAEREFRLAASIAVRAAAAALGSAMRSAFSASYSL